MGSGGPGAPRPTTGAAPVIAPTSAAGGSRRTPGNGGGTRAPRRRRLIDYPRQGKTGIRRWLPSWRLLLGLFLTLVLLVVGALVWAYTNTKIPEPAEFAEAQTSTVFFADGTEMGTFGVQNRVIVEGSTIPQHVMDAAVAAEDRTFYENPGINPAGIVRALWNNLRGGDKQGGSSITQQYAERYYSDSTVSDYRGKLNEALLAVKLARQQDKPEILANYLNTIYFGRDSYGIETAAQSYFGVGVADLTIAQGALILGIIPSPNNWDPRVDAAKAEQRWNYVLDGMVTTGTLTQAERDEQVFPETVEYARSDTFAGPNGYLLDMVRREILASGRITESELLSNGYRIVSTVDRGLQDMAVAAVQGTLPADKPANLHTALVTLNPVDGSIVALYGGPDFLVQSQNAVTQDIAQAGSTFKPFALIATLEQGNSLRSMYDGNSLIEVEGFPEPVRNFGRGDGESFGEIDLVDATANSVNAVYAKVNTEVGPAVTLEVARRAGLPDEALVGQEVPANVLGTAAPHPIDMAQAFNTFAANGVRYEPFIVRTVEYLSGGVVFEGGSDGERVFEADVMADVTYALSQVVEEGTATKAQAVGYPIAGKTGTSNENKSAWFIGYTSQLTTAVAMYQSVPGGSPESITPFGGVSQVTGGSFPLDVWTAYMTPAMAGRELIDFPPRADIGEPNEPPTVAIPSVAGLPEAEARAAVEGAGFSVVIERPFDPTVPEGTAIGTNPSGEAEEGAAVAIQVSAGPEPPALVGVPDVVGRNASDAQAILEAAGFVVTTTTQVDDAAEPGTVLSTNPSGEAEEGSTVTMVVAEAPEVVEPPVVVDPPVVSPPPTEPPPPPEPPAVP